MCILVWYIPPTRGRNSMILLTPKMSRGTLKTGSKQARGTSRGVSKPKLSRPLVGGISFLFILSYHFCYERDKTRLKRMGILVCVFWYENSGMSYVYSSMKSPYIYVYRFYAYFCLNRILGCYAPVILAPVEGFSLEPCPTFY